MSQPKKKNTPNLDVDNQSSMRMSQNRRTKLENIQKREKLKSMLVNKFKSKQGISGDDQRLADEVSQFVKTEKLTEENLKRLDEKISMDAANYKQSKSVASSVKSQSVKSFGKASSKRNKSPSNYSETCSIASSKTAQSLYREHQAEEDQWANINKFNTVLYQQEQLRRKTREVEMKNKMRSALDTQKVEKYKRREIENIESGEYYNSQLAQINLYDQKEESKRLASYNKIEQEKIDRAKQIELENKTKKRIIKEERQNDLKTVQRLKEELEAESKMNMDKRENEKRHLMKMLKENDENKKEKEKDKERERQNDIHSQEEYARMLDKQEADRANEFATRMKKMQGLMNRMADTVVADQREKQRQEDERIKSAFVEREEQERINELERYQLTKKQKYDNKEFLHHQMENRVKQRELERIERMEQAEMWRKDSENQAIREAANANKVEKMNMDHVKILKEQMSQKDSKKRVAQKMNPMEIKINNQLLKEIHKDIVKN